MYASKKLPYCASYLRRVSNYLITKILPSARFLFCNIFAVLQKIYSRCRVNVGLFEVLSPKLLTRELYIFVRRFLLKNICRQKLAYDCGHPPGFSRVNTLYQPCIKAHRPLPMSFFIITYAIWRISLLLHSFSSAQYYSYSLVESLARASNCIQMRRF